MWIFADFEYATFLDGVTQSKTFEDIDRSNKPNNGKMLIMEKLST